MWSDSVAGVKQALIIWILGDGKPGHENQSLGLAEAMGRRVACEVHRIPARPWREALSMAAELPRPDLIVGAGHSTHGLLWWLSRRYRARSVVMMRPSLPKGLFDMLVAPEHDFKNPPLSGGSVLATRGALNRVVPVTDGSRKGTLVLLGGPSKHHGWDAEGIREMISEISARAPGVEVADSRRTPDGFFASLDFINARHAHRETPPGWFAAWLARAEEVWVTEDSVSMVYEALTGGARVGILPVPRLKKNARVIQGLDRLADGGWVTRYADWRENEILPAPPHRLAEADRVAEWLLESMPRTG